MTVDEAAEAMRRLAPDEPLTPVAAVAAVTATAETGREDPQALLAALVLVRWAQNELAATEPVLVAAARAAGVSWQRLAPALGVASRQAAERRFLRAAQTGHGPDGTTQDERVTAERDRRAGQRAVDEWANAHTADLRRLAGRITALSDLGQGAAADVAGLDRALAGTDATGLPGLLARARRHLGDHPDLAGEVGAVGDSTDRVRRRTQTRRERDR